MVEATIVVVLVGCHGSRDCIVHALNEVVAVRAVLAAITVTVVLEELADRLSVFDIFVEVRAVISFFTLASQKIDANFLFDL